MSSAPSIKQSQDATATPTPFSRFKIRPLEPTNDIRKYFRPRYNPVPTQEYADSADEDSEDDSNKGRVNTRNGGLFRSNYTPVKQGSGSEYEDTDEEEDSDDPNPSRPTPPPPQTSNAMVARQDTSLKNRHQQPPTLKKEEDDSSDPDPIDLITRSTIPSPPAPNTHPIRSPTNPTLMAITSPALGSESESEQEYLSAEEPELALGPSINTSSFNRVINIHTGAELDADTEEDSEEDGEEGDGVGSADEVLVRGRGVAR